MVAGNGAGRDDIGGDALRAEFLGQRFAQPPGAMLGDGHMAAPVIALDGVHAGDIDNPPPALCDHARKAGAREPEGG